MPRPQGFTYEQRADGTVVITHGARRAATLRGARAAEFVAQAESGDAQLAMARWTGNYRRGNERTAKAHPRNG
ncbi:hypothetical protein [Streptomyces silvensis]|uniref:Uncharacterized protein n=1 Tax=Streptomyces silvensis TaxID=1765722 RepID=A0A0W7X588_9ACTN|nr:hypothetical protein [Streptomyces silvensis]KUF18044.1 hypothetical protein AT728_20650 [Streptomyces silvensis]